MLLAWLLVAWLLLAWVGVRRGAHRAWAAASGCEVSADARVRLEAHPAEGAAPLAVSACLLPLLGCELSLPRLGCVSSLPLLGCGSWPSWGVGRRCPCCGVAVAAPPGVWMLPLLGYLPEAGPP